MAANSNVAARKSGSATKTNGAKPLSPVEQRLADLRRLATTDQPAAAEATWQWLHELRDRLPAERTAVLSDLDEMYRNGSAYAIDGETEGLLVTWTFGPVPDRLLNAVFFRWQPWIGKRFDAARNRGDNMMDDVIKLPMKFLIPWYSTTPFRKGAVTALEFATRVEKGRVDPDTEVTVVDYAAVKGTPSIPFLDVRDEVTEIVPGVSLGKFIFKPVVGSYTNGAYFAARYPRKNV